MSAFCHLGLPSTPADLTRAEEDVKHLLAVHLGSSIFMKSAL